MQSRLQSFHILQPLSFAVAKEKAEKVFIKGFELGSSCTCCPTVNKYYSQVNQQYLVKDTRTMNPR